jgi:hypothetical protein
MVRCTKKPADGGLFGLAILQFFRLSAITAAPFTSGRNVDNRVRVQAQLR